MASRKRTEQIQCRRLSLAGGRLLHSAGDFRSPADGCCTVQEAFARRRAVAAQCRRLSLAGGRLLHSAEGFRSSADGSFVQKAFKKRRKLYKITNNEKTFYIMKINKINVGKLRNEAHYQFFTAVIALTVKFPLIVEKLGDLFGLLQRLFAKEDEVVDYIAKSDYSAKIAAADERLDNAVVGFSETVRGALYHFRPEVADAALSLKNLMKTYGNIIRKSYDEELAAVTNLLQELEGAYAEKVSLISGSSEWIAEIKAASENETVLLALRNTEKANKPQERMVNVRDEVNSVYRDIVAKIEALTLVEGDTAYASFVNELNALIERFNKIRSRKAEKDSESNVEP
jgi:hypothetical protein